VSVLLAASSNPILNFTWVHTNEALIWSELGQHAELSGIAVGCGLLISLPLAMLAWRLRAARTLILALAGLLYTIPSIALFVLIQPITGYFSLLTAEVALTGYTLLILVRNTLTGLDAIPEDVREAASAMGYGRGAQLVRVYLPLALPAIFAGLRVATVTVVGLVTITALIGRGGLGVLITQGFEDSFYTPIDVALILSILLAGAGDAAWVLLERFTVRWRRVRPREA
jgi:osmoprotectant transport system permease protein